MLSGIDPGVERGPGDRRDVGDRCIHLVKCKTLAQDLFQVWHHAIFYVSVQKGIGNAVDANDQSLFHFV